MIGTRVMSGVTGRKLPADPSSPSSLGRDLGALRQPCPPSPMDHICLGHPTGCILCLLLLLKTRKVLASCGDSVPSLILKAPGEGREQIWVVELGQDPGDTVIHSHCS